MAKDSSDTGVNNQSLSLDDSSSNKSFVKKVKSRVSGFLPSLTKWFGTTESQVRYRDDSDDEDDDEESFRIQPPTKRSKPNDTNAPVVNFQTNSISARTQISDVSQDILSPINSANHVVKTKLTFPEPIAGPSGYKPKQNLTSGKSSLNKQLYSIHNEVMNGDKYSDSGESVTSGYSSMLIGGGKDVIVENSKTENTEESTNNESMFTFNKSSRLKNDRSLFEDHCTSPRQQQANASLSARQPSFNSSVFGSPTFVDRTLASRKILNSPFYSGRTAYGGASAYGRSLASIADTKTSSLRNTVQIKPVNESTSKQTKGGSGTDNSTLSKTARRILDTLEQYTTPITDAKKIPNPTNPNNTSSRKRYLAGANPYSACTPSKRALQVPTVPDLLKMKLKERLQDSTVSVRQLANSSKSVLNREEYKIRTLEDDAGNSTKHMNKIRNKISSVRQKNDAPVENVMAEEVKLPEIRLPITTLPKFDFTLPPFEPSTSSKTTETMVKTSISTTVKTVEKIAPMKKSKVQEGSTQETCKKKCVKRSRTAEEFVFSDPLIIAENLKKPIKAINNFIFSEPTPTIATNKTKSTEKAAVTTKNNGECRKETSSGNPLDTFKQKPTDDLLAKFKPSNDTWECSVCLIRNVNTRSKCAACETPRPQDTAKKEPTSNNNKATLPACGFGDKFKMADGQWSCKVCLVVNTSDKNKCVACESAKDGGENRLGLIGPGMWECTTCLVRNKDSDVKCAACTGARNTIANGPLLKSAETKNGFGNKFAPPPDTWLCDTCSIRNKNDLQKCLACQASRPAGIKAIPPAPVGFGDSFKKKDDQWECDTCMVRNSADRQKCQCCDALRPGAKNVAKEEEPKQEKSNLSLFNFGIDPGSQLTTRGFTFGINPNEKREDSISTSFTPIFGHSNAATCTTFSMVTTPATSTATFSFGIKPTAQEEKTSENVVKESEVMNSSRAIGKHLEPQKSEEKAPEVKKDDITTLNGEITSDVVFGEPPAVKNAESSSSIFDKDPNPAPPALFFSAAPTTVTTAIPSAPIFGATPTPAFKFGESTATTDKPANSSLFTANAKSDTVTFGTVQAPPTATFGTPAASLFGGNDSNKIPAFGALSPPAQPTVETGGAATAIVAFGTAAPPKTVDRDELPPPAKMPVFSFGQTPKKAEMEQLPKFGFGGAATQSTSAPSPASFFVVAAQPSLNFNVGSNASASGGFDNAAASQNGMFKFGANAHAPVPKPGFNFGTPTSAVQQAQGPANAVCPPNPTNNHGIFNFGFSGNAPAPSTGGFNFSGSTGADFKPNFNFTGAAQPPTFSAQPNPDDKSTRITRKAVRRVHR